MKQANRLSIGALLIAGMMFPSMIFAATSTSSNPNGANPDADPHFKIEIPRQKPHIKVKVSSKGKKAPKASIEAKQGKTKGSTTRLEVRNGEVRVTTRTGDVTTVHESGTNEVIRAAANAGKKYTSVLSTDRTHYVSPSSRVLEQDDLVYLLNTTGNTYFGEPVIYYKTARIVARESQGGEEIYTILADGTLETPEPTLTEPGDYVVKNLNGGPEQWVVKAQVIKKKYQIDPELQSSEDGWSVFKPAGGDQVFVQTNVDVKLNTSWGATQELRAGSHLNVTNKDTDVPDIYGVAPDEFNATYARALDRAQAKIAEGKTLSQDDLVCLYKEAGDTYFGEPATYYKTARIVARESQGGEAIYTILADGTLETPEPTLTEPGDYVVKNLNGGPEQWVVKAQVMKKKYVPAPELGEGVFKPAGGDQVFVQLKQGMTLKTPWDAVLTYDSGDFINITDINQKVPDIYGVAADEFNATYAKK